MVATTGCDKDDNYYPAPEFEGDPTAEYIEANVDFDTQISQENSDPDTFYTYFCLCNASDHKIYFTLTFCPTKNDEFIDHMNGLVDPGKKYTNRFVTSNWSMDVPGLITTFSRHVEHVLLRNEPEGVGRVCFLLRNDRKSYRHQPQKQGKKSDFSAHINLNLLSLSSPKVINAKNITKTFSVEILRFIKIVV